MTTRAILVSGVVLTAVIAASSLTMAGDNRTMRSGELFSLWGGGDLANSCCTDIAQCVSADKLCPDYPLDVCNSSFAHTHFNGNNKTCARFLQGQLCTQSDTLHVCFESRQCMISTVDPTKCIVRGPQVFATVNAPNDCTPICP